MRRDWIWGWAAVLPALLVAFVVLEVTGLLHTASEWVATGSAMAIVGSIATGVLWIRNRRSIQRARQCGRDVELIIRPVDALASAAFLFPTIFGAMTLVRLLFDTQIDEWGRSIVFSGAFAYVTALTSTAYRKADFSVGRGDEAEAIGRG